MARNNININITADGSNVSKVASQIEKDLAKMSDKAQKSTKGIGVGGITAGVLLAKGLGKALSVISNSVDDAVKRLDTLNNFPKVMSNLAIGGEDAQKSINIMSEKLRGLPTTLDAGALAVQRFTASNGNIKASTSYFLALNNAVLAGNAPLEIQKTAIEQLSQAYSKGKPDVLEWRAMMSAMPAQLKQVSQSLGLSGVEDLKQQLTSGALTMDGFLQELVKLNKQGVGEFASLEEQARASTGGVQTALANLRNVVVRSITDIMNAIGQANITAFINGIYKAIESVTPYVVAFVKVIAWAVSAISSLLGGGAKGGEKIKKSFEGATKATAGIGGGVANTEKGLKGANKQAKELKNTLAGFDEMTVLTEPKQSTGAGGAGGGAGGAGGADLSGIGDDLWAGFDANKGKSKADELADNFKQSFMSAFNEIQKLASWQAFTNGLKKIFETLGKNIGRIFGGIKTSFTLVGDSMVQTLASRGGELDLAMANLISSMANVASQSIDLVSAPFIGLIDGINLQLAEKAPLLTDSLATIFIGISQLLSNTFNNLSTILEPLTTSLQEGFTSIGSLGAGIFIDMATSLAEKMPEIIANATTLQNSLTDTFTKISSIVGTIWTDLCKTLDDNWKKYGKGITDEVAKFINKLVEHWNKINTEILEPVIKPFLEELEKVWKETLKPMIDEVVKFVLKLTQAALQIYNNFIAPIKNFLVGLLAPAFVTIGSTIGGVMNTILSTIGGVITGILKVFNGLIDFLTGVFTGNWKQAWEGVKNIFSGIAQGLGAIFKAPLNLMIDLINGFIRGLNKIKIPDWVPGVGGKGFHINPIPKLAKGGVIDRATLAVVGEAGKEVVMPLENNTGWIDQLAFKISEVGGVSHNQSDQPIQVIVKVGEDTLAEKIIENINDRTAMSGLNSIVV